MVYAVYINANLGQQEGRKIAKEHAVPNPNPQCMLQAAKDLGFEATLEEERCHPRSFWERGRLSIVFFDGAGEGKKPLKPEIPNRRALYKAIAAKVIELGNTSSNKTVTTGTKKLRGIEKTQARKEANRKK